MNAGASTSNPGPLGVVDVGAHSVRLEIAQFGEDGQVQTLDRLQHDVPLGADAFSNGVISAENVRMVGDILRDFATVMNEYGVRNRRAVATSAVREADNRDIFVHRVEQMSGIRLAILDGPEEIRLIFTAVADILSERFGLNRYNAVIFTIGTGASLISFLEKGMLKNCETVRLGTLRVVEQLEGPVSYNRLRDLIDPFVGSVVSEVTRMASTEKPELFVAVGSTVRTLIRLGGRRVSGKVATMTRGRFEEIFERIADVPVADLASRYSISDTMAQSLQPCCDMLEHFFDMTETNRLLVPMITTRDALIQDFYREMIGQEDRFVPQILSVADHIGRRYHYDAEHARSVADLACVLFDQLRELHGLTDRDRLLLEVAALLHDIGQFVSRRAHHKHSFYLVRHSEIPGISPHEQEVLAAVVRYHRRSMPRSQHLEYTSLPSDERVRVCKLAALLRVVDGLDRRHQGRIRTLRATIEDNALVLNVEGPDDLTLEQWGLRRKADLFESVFGLRVILVAQS